MSYTPKTWNTGDTVTATDLNNIENGIANGSSWDAIISIYHDNNSGHEYGITIESGSYASLKQKLMNNQPPVILAYIWDNLNGYMGSTTMTSIYSFPYAQGPNNDFVFAVKMPSSSTTSHTNWFALMLTWNSNNEIAIW